MDQHTLFARSGQEIRSLIKTERFFPKLFIVYCLKELRNIKSLILNNKFRIPLRLLRVPDLNPTFIILNIFTNCKKPFTSSRSKIRINQLVPVSILILKKQSTILTIKAKKGEKKLYYLSDRIRIHNTVTVYTGTTTYSPSRNTWEISYMAHKENFLPIEL